MKKIGVIERSEAQTSEPARYITKSKAAKFVDRGYAKWIIPEKTIQMIKTVDAIRGDAAFLKTSWKVLKAIAETRGPENLLLSYPHRDQSSSVRPFGAGALA